MKTNGMTKGCVKWGALGAGVLFFALAACPQPAQAKMIRGEVVTVKDDGSSFGVKRSDPSDPSQSEHYDIVMRPDTKFEKIGSLKELAVGDEVVVDAVQKKKSNIWEAHSVRIFKMRLYQTDESQKAQPD